MFILFIPLYAVNTKKNDATEYSPLTATLNSLSHIMILLSPSYKGVIEHAYMMLVNNVNVNKYQ